MRSKTDKTDTGLITHFCAAIRPEPWQPLPKVSRQRLDLVRRLDALSEMPQQERNRLKAAQGVIAGQPTARAACFEGQSKETKRLINEHLGQDPDLKDRAQLRACIPSIGEATIHLILGEISRSHALRRACWRLGESNLPTLEGPGDACRPRFCKRIVRTR